MTPTPEPLAEARLADGSLLTLRRASDADVPVLLGVVHAAFGARPVRGAPPAALTETAATLAAALAEGDGYLAEVDGTPAAVTLVRPNDRRPGVWLNRVGVHPDFQRLGIASLMVLAILETLAVDGVPRATALARQEYPEIGAWWERHGFERVGAHDDCWVMTRTLPVVVEVPDADAMRALGARLAALLRPGDLLIASGDLGAGKTTLAQGIGAGLRVAGPVISPTFVLSRVHPSTVGGPALVHVDAYRLGGFAEVEDLDLEASLDGSVTLIEWGSGVAEGLADDRLDVDIRRGLDPDDETRWVFLTPVGARWSRDELAAAAAREG